MKILLIEGKKERGGKKREREGGIGKGGERGRETERDTLYAIAYKLSFV